MSYTSLVWNSRQNEALDSLRAEREAHWLHEVFVEPLEFEHIAGMRSCVVFGASGSGKSALGLALAQRASAGVHAPANLVVEWRPTLTPPGQTGSEVVRTCLAQALDACALALFRLIGRQPERFTPAPLWVQETLRWFIHQYLSGDRDIRLSKLQEEISPLGADLLRDVITQVPREVLRPGAPEPQIIAELANALQRIGLAGLWVIVDGLEPWFEAEEETLTQMLKALFSTLSLFEEPGFAMKVLVPAEIETSVMANGAIVRRRMDVYHLDWRDDQLATIVERRLALMTQKSAFRLTDLSTSSGFAEWLKRYGGQLPRAWLELIRPFAETYIQSGAARRLTDQECSELRRAHPPKLRVEAATNRVFIGHGEIRDIQPGGYKLLHYLYEQYPRPCTRSELFYRVYKGLAQEPHSRYDEGWEDPVGWEGIVDTLIWRLRKKIEPDQKKPLYIITDRGKGIRLENRW